MKREIKKETKRPLELKRETVRVIKDDVLHQIKGGAKSDSSYAALDA